MSDEYFRALLALYTAAPGVCNTAPSPLCGRTQLTLRCTAWPPALPVRFEELKREYARAHRGSGKRFDLALIPLEQHPVFNITPDKVRGQAQTRTCTCCGPLGSVCSDFLLHLLRQKSALNNVLKW